jgi:hypothetical protein
MLWPIRFTKEYFVKEAVSCLVYTCLVNGETESQMYVGRNVKCLLCSSDFRQKRNVLANIW